MKDKERRWLRQRSCLIISCIVLGTLTLISQRNNAILGHSFQLPALGAATAITANSPTSTPELTLIVPSTFEDYQCYSTRFFDILYNDIIDPPDQIIFVISHVPMYASPHLDFPAPPLHLKPNKNIAIKILSFQSHQTASQNRNIGAYVATGTVLTFFDIDDRPHPQRFQIIRQLFKDNPHVDAALFNYVNGTHADGLNHTFQTIDVENLPQHYDISKLKKAYQQFWRLHPEYHPDYFELWCCRPVDKYMANGWGTYRRNIFLEFKYKEGLKSGEDTDLNARLIFSKTTGFTFWELELGFYNMMEGVDSDGDPELKGKSALISEGNEEEKNKCPFSSIRKNSRTKDKAAVVPGLVCPRKTTTTTSTSSTCSSTTTNKLKREVNNDQDPRVCRPLLFAGCGYSGTGFLGKLFSSAGYDVPHECLGNDGTSDWRYSFEMTRPLPFRHIYMQVRHPLAVVASWHSVQWNFTVDKRWQQCLKNPAGTIKNWKLEELDVRDYFKAGDLIYLSREVHALEWWSQSVSRILPAVECWWRIEDFSSQVAKEVCNKAGFIGCSVPDWERLIKEHAHENSHRIEDVNAPKPTWESMCGKEQVQKDDSRSKRVRVCERARALCREFNFDNC
jgi:hypothetical protein